MSDGERWKGHPLQTLLNAPRNVQFNVGFRVYQTSYPSAPLYDSVKNIGVGVTAYLQNPGEARVLAFTAVTDQNGKLPVTTVSIAPASAVIFVCHVKDKTLANIAFEEDIDTDAASMLEAASSGTFNRSYELRSRIYPKYADFFRFLQIYDKESILGNSSIGIAAYVTDDNTLVKTLSEFELSYRDANFNVMFEGDSWFHYPPNDKIDQDLYASLKAKLQETFKPGDSTPKRRCQSVAFQHFGDTSDQMFSLDPGPGGDADEHTQFHYTKRCLNSYQFELIVLSSGGNDIGEPGISAHKKKDDDVATYRKYIVPDPAVAQDHYYDFRYFDPYEAVKESSSTATDRAERLQGNAGYWLKRSFPILLKNHLWSLYLDGKEKSDQQTQVDLEPELTTLLGLSPTDYNDLGKSLAKAADKALAFPDPATDPSVDFPNMALTNSLANQVLDKIFVKERFKERFDDIRANMVRFLDHVAQTQDTTKLLVLCHTYCYAIFTDGPTDYFKQRGPWFHNRLRQARIAHPLAQSVAIKYLIDYFRWNVLEDLKNTYGPWFDYYDARQLNRKSGDWMDEIHLTTTGFERVASGLMQTIKTKFGADFQ
ncbi:MAG: hypothetical protein DMF56_21815 [Acidobacteria bacterium]|nr:MAG: hypothetical protein DMF56_21815 [Acidobacteriota bacterium]